MRECLKSVSPEYSIRYIKFPILFYSNRCAEQSKFSICTASTDNSSVGEGITQQRYIPIEAILEAQGCSAPLWLNTLVLIGFLVIFRLLGYFVLRYVRCPK